MTVTLGSDRDRSHRDRNDAVIAKLAAKQHSVVTRRQLLELGISSAAVSRRRRRGTLRAVHRGVYVVGPVVPPRAREMAACLACGPGAAVSHSSAAALWEIEPPQGSDRRTDVVLPKGNRRPNGVRVHRTTTLHPDEVTRLDRIPVTTAARTLLDLARRAGGRAVERAVAEARARRLVRPGELRAVLERHEGRPGTSALRDILDAGPVFTRSEAEERFLALVREAGVPEPGVNERVAGLEVDFTWSDERLVVEIDGYAFHSSRRAFTRDRRRDAELVAAGFRVVRFTWQQITGSPGSTLFQLGRALAAGR